ncbi:MAG: hypothetical protein U0892_21555 [Pirellulales bacterium]
MTLLGKVFTGMLFVLSVSFFLIALMVNASHINYRDQVEKPETGYDARIKAAQGANQALTEELQIAKNNLALEQAARRHALAALQTELEIANRDLASKDSELSKVQSQLTALTQTEKSTQEELQARTKDNEELRQQLIAARDDRNNQYQTYLKTFDQLLRLQGEKKSIEGNYKDLIRDHTAAVEKLNILGLTPNSKLDGPPSVNGEITAVATNRVELSLGKDDGIREGHSLDVYRGGAYLGRIRVTRSEDDRSVAEILPDFQKGFMKVGDRVDSRISDRYVKPVTTP